MNDRQIACFLEAVKERNFTKVAEKNEKSPEV